MVPSFHNQFLPQGAQKSSRGTTPLKFEKNIFGSLNDIDIINKDGIGRASLEMGSKTPNNCQKAPRRRIE